jgi:excisionase family DNA binding protein
MSDALKTDDLPLSLDPKQTAKVLNCNLRHVYECLPRGEIPGARKIGGLWRINRDILLASFRDKPAPR